MNCPTDILLLAKDIGRTLAPLGVEKRLATAERVLYDEIVTDSALKKKTEKLFKDGHHARAVEEAYKLLDNLVKKRAGLSHTDLTGANLMRNVFSAKNPVLRLNEGVSASEKNEQEGYMNIFAGCMTGIRNPRAHESDWEDTEQRALQLLALANHLIERTTMAEKVAASTS